VSRDIGVYNLQTDVMSVTSVQVGHKPGVRVTSIGHSTEQPPGGAQVEPSRRATPVYEGESYESTVWSNQRVGRQRA